MVIVMTIKGRSVIQLDKIARLILTVRSLAVTNASIITPVAELKERLANSVRMLKISCTRHWPVFKLAG